MVKVIAIFQSDETKLPPGELSDDDLEHFHEDVHQVADENPGVEWNGLFLSEDGIGYADWEAPDVETLKPYYEVWEEEDDVPIDSLVAVEKII
ncbi:DUF4242 domain-containing protein [haloarchaeon 3A1-DGR]|nr:DUF4242 domain-containing protein [haloarchaeon 3A1-DGR]